MIAITLCTLPLLAQQTANDGQVADEKKQTAQQTETKPANIQSDLHKNEPARRFTPSEQLRADDAISFPVDI